MSKIITFSRVFPSYHPKAGKPTYFIEAILTQLGINYKVDSYAVWLIENNPKISPEFLMQFFYSLSKDDMWHKSHTIRNHKKPLKIGDYIIPKCWAGKPYNKTAEGYWQIKFAPDIEVKKIFYFEIDDHVLKIDGKNIYGSDGDILAKNDGLEWFDLLQWFEYPKNFKGQIICWNDRINY